MYPLINLTRHLIRELAYVAFMLAFASPPSDPPQLLGQACRCAPLQRFHRECLLPEGQPPSLRQWSGDPRRPLSGWCRSAPAPLRGRFTDRPGHNPPQHIWATRPKACLDGPSPPSPIGSLSTFGPRPPTAFDPVTFSGWTTEPFQFN